jgi:hypothetical protein
MTGSSPPSGDADSLLPLLVRIPGNALVMALCAARYRNLGRAPPPLEDDPDPEEPPFEFELEPVLEPEFELEPELEEPPLEPAPDACTVTVGALLDVSWPTRMPTPNAIRSVATAMIASIVDGRPAVGRAAGARALARWGGRLALKRGAPRRVPHSTQ